MAPTLSPDDLQGIWHVWPRAVACPTWRLWGESPSMGLLHHVWSKVDHCRVLRDEGRVVGLLDVREANPVSATGYLGFLLSSSGRGLEQHVLPFLRESLSALRLQRVTVLVDEDMLSALTDALPHLRRVGLLRAHTLATAGQYVDRHVYELTGGVTAS